jgi:hypothetical protein
VAAVGNFEPHGSQYAETSELSAVSDLPAAWRYPVLVFVKCFENGSNCDRFEGVSHVQDIVGGSGMFDRCLRYTGKSFFGVHGDCQEPGTHLPQLLCQDSNITLTSRAQTLTEHHLDQTHSVANSINVSSPTTHYG